STDVPIELTMEGLRIQPPDAMELAGLYRELGFTSLLKELGEAALTYPVREEAGPARKRDYAEFSDVGEFREWLQKLPAKKPLSLWLHLDAAGRGSDGVGEQRKGGWGFAGGG